MLTVLLLHANEPVGEERLIESIWGAHPPAGARNTLQVYVSRLRKALGADAVLTGPAGYLISLVAEQLDLARFRRLAAAGTEALVHGDSESAARDLGAALRLWSGPALGDVARSPSGEEALRGLDEERLVVQERFFDAELAAGRHADLVGELHALVVAQPFREGLRRQLMLALYRAGRQAEALAAYREARSTFVEGLGIEPTPALQRLEQAILRQDAELESPPRAAAPVAGLPVQATPLLGREREVAELALLIGDPAVRLVTLTGPGGIGKTRLALAAASTREGRTAFVPLGSITDPELVAPTIAAALGIPERPGEPALVAVSAHAQAQPLLLVLDNFEQLLSAAPLLGQLLAAAPALQLMVTSRAVLRLAGEHEYEVPPLEGASAVHLFEQRARATDPGFQPDASVEELCLRLDGLPLAIELAAARTKLLAPAAMLERLEHRLDLLGGGRRDGPERQLTLRATIDWSYDLLADSERRLFERLAVFVGGWTLDAAEAVCATDLNTLGLILDKSFVRQSGGRFTMLETLREYAGERFATAEGRADTVDRHAAYFLELAEQAELQLEGSSQLEWVDRLEAERGNLRAAYSHLFESGRVVEALELAAALRRFWQIHGHLEAGRGWLEAALAAVPAAPPELTGRALNGVGILAAEQGDLDAAEVAFEASLELARRLGDPVRVNATLGNLGNIATFRGDYQRARAYCEESLDVARSIGGRSQRVAIALENLGSVLIVQGELDGAIALLRESYASAGDWGAPRQQASAARTLARALLLSGDVGQADALNGESLELTRRMGEANGTADCLETAGGIAARRGKEADAARLFGAADALRESIGARRHRNNDVWYRDAEAELRESLGDSFESNFEHGRAMATSDVLTLIRPS